VHRLHAAFPPATDRLAKPIRPCPGLAILSQPDQMLDGAIRFVSRHSIDPLFGRSRGVIAAAEPARVKSTRNRSELHACHRHSCLCALAFSSTAGFAQINRSPSGAPPPPVHDNLDLNRRQLGISAKSSNTFTAPHGGIRPPYFFAHRFGPRGRRHMSSERKPLRISVAARATLVTIREISCVSELGREGSGPARNKRHQ